MAKDRSVGSQEAGIETENAPPQAQEENQEFNTGDIQELEYLLHSAAFLIRRLPRPWKAQFAVTGAAIDLQLFEERATNIQARQ